MAIVDAVQCSSCGRLFELGQEYVDGYRPQIHWSRGNRSDGGKIPLCPGWDKPGVVVQAERVGAEAPATKPTQEPIDVARRIVRDEKRRQLGDLAPTDWELLVLNLLAGNGPMMEHEVAVGLGHAELRKITPTGRWQIYGGAHVGAVYKAVKRLKTAGEVVCEGGGRGRVGRYRITEAGEARRQRP